MAGGVSLYRLGVKNTHTHTQGCDANHPAGIKSPEKVCSWVSVGRWVAQPVSIAVIRYQ